MRHSLLAIINFILILVLALGTLVFLFWRVGIFKKEAEVSKNVSLIRDQIDFINNYSFQEIGEYFRGLSAVKVEIPDLKADELGRQSLF